ncbi:MAG: hypothetical protein KAU01_07205 [Candidatus Cloacimonetes bacterium]|nr:hypothetical protein [Candidatus Cloacimonadota bacterium]
MSLWQRLILVSTFLPELQAEGSVHEGSYFEQNQEISICQSGEVFLVTYFDDPKEVTGKNPLKFSLEKGDQMEVVN